jgi:hypothetical protein
MRRKNEGVVLAGMTTGTIEALVICDKVFSDESLDMMITSGNDSHSAAYHCMEDGSCQAFDLRLPSRLMVAKFGAGAWVPREYRLDQIIRDRLHDALPFPFQVVLERHQDNPYVWHIHVEEDTNAA